MRAQAKSTSRISFQDEANLNRSSTSRGLPRRHSADKILTKSQTDSGNESVSMIKPFKRRHTSLIERSAVEKVNKREDDLRNSELSQLASNFVLHQVISRVLYVVRDGNVH